MFDGRRFGRLAKANLAESWRSYAWFFGVAIGGVVYYAMTMARPRATLRATAPAA